MTIMKRAANFFFFVFLLFGNTVFINAQDTLLVETFGKPAGGTPIVYYNGWDNLAVDYSGTGTLRNLISSCGTHINAGNILLEADQYFSVSEIEVGASDSLKITFDMYNRNVLATSDSLKFYVKEDDGEWMECFLENFPTTIGWKPQEIALELSEGTSELAFKIINLSSTCIFFFDYLVFEDPYIQPETVDTIDVEDEDSQLDVVDTLDIEDVDSLLDVVDTTNIELSDSLTENIETLDDVVITDSKSVDKDNFSLSTISGGVKIDFNKQDLNVVIYSLLGRVVTRFDSKLGETDISLSSGVYILNIGNYSRKFVVK